MNIKEELNNFLNENLRKLENKTRDIEIINYYYGFGSAQWPTLDETSKYFQLESRERVRQLLNKKFRSFVNEASIVSISSFYKLVKTRNFWIYQELEHLIIENGFANPGEFTLKGLFNLLEDIGFNTDFDIYSPFVTKLTRTTINDFENNLFILERSRAVEIKKLFSKALKITGRCGIANLNYLDNELLEYKKLIKTMIKSLSSAWYQEENQNFWYSVEDRENTLINYSEKVFKIISECEVQKLAECYRNALDSRTFEYPYPSKELIVSYLKNSKYFKFENEKLIFVGECSEINPIEQAIVDYLTDNQDVDFPKIKKYLMEFNFNENTINKSVCYSPFVFVDKSLGRSHHKYSLIGNKISPISNEKTRYETYAEKLARFIMDGTDKTIEQTVRNEQAILREWLFEGKTEECCAICGNIYKVQTLVTAHKKPRAICNEFERIDPNIVMPVCVMGCDYLYEHKYVLIKDGVVIVGTIDITTDELKFINNIVGRKIDERWLSGSKNYFRSVDL